MNRPPAQAWQSVQQTNRRRQASLRLPPLSCGCKDPLDHERRPWQTDRGDVARARPGMA